MPHCYICDGENDCGDDSDELGDVQIFAQCKLASKVGIPGTNVDVLHISQAQYIY